METLDTQEEFEPRINIMYNRVMNGKLLFHEGLKHIYRRNM